MKTLTLIERLALRTLSMTNVSGVYSGKPGKCCCGCAGNHRYNSAFVNEAGANRGYAVDADEINDRQVAKIIGLLQANEALVEAGGNHFSAEINGRLYIAYLLEAK